MAHHLEWSESEVKDMDSSVVILPQNDETGAKRNNNYELFFRRKIMKRYLLLATTAMFMAGNAMAGSIAPDGQSATIGVSVGMTAVDFISGATDIDFGTLLTDGNGEEEDLVRMSTDGTMTKLGSHLLYVPATGTAGTLTLSSYGRSTGFAIECAFNGADISASSNNQCPLEGASASGFSIKKVTIAGSDGSYTLGATLHQSSDTIIEKTNFPGVIRVVLQYE